MTATIAPQSRLDALSGSEEAIRNCIETHMIDDCGLVLSHLNPATLRPWTGAEIADGGHDLPAFCHPHCADPDAYFAYGRDRDRPPGMPALPPECPDTPDRAIRESGIHARRH